jgi:hypothetical protein
MQNEPKGASSYLHIKRWRHRQGPFIDHFQEIAKAHFTVRRLERRYGKDTVRRVYDELSGTTVEAL